MHYQKDTIGYKPLNVLLCILNVFFSSILRNVVIRNVIVEELSTEKGLITLSYCKVSE